MGLPPKEAFHHSVHAPLKKQIMRICKLRVPLKSNLSQCSIQE